MNSDTPRSAVRIAGHPVLRILVSFPVACFCAALVTDIAYSRTADITWADFSDWLLAGGMAMGVLAAIAGVVAAIADRRTRRQRRLWPVVAGSIVTLLLGFLNNLVHSRDAWTSVVPQGLVLSVLTVVVMLITIWLASDTVYRVGVVPYTGVRP
jgi:uncharacterized membrane protein